MVQHSKCPVVKTEDINFVRIIDQTGINDGVFVPVRFARQVHWLRESKTTSILRLRDGEIVKQGDTYTDYYGFLSSYHDPLDFAKKTAKARSLGANSELVSECVVTISDTPVIVPSQQVINGSTVGRVYHTGLFYLPIPQDWLVDDELAQAKLDGWNNPPKEFTIYPVTQLEAVNTEVVIWSSANTDEENVIATNSLMKYSEK